MTFRLGFLLAFLAVALQATVPAWASQWSTRNYAGEIRNSLISKPMLGMHHHAATSGMSASVSGATPGHLAMADAHAAAKPFLMCCCCHCDGAWAGSSMCLHVPLATLGIRFSIPEVPESWTDGPEPKPLQSGPSMLLRPPIQT